MGKKKKKRIPSITELKNGDRLPTYIKLSSTTMRFRRNCNDYYRDAGNWSSNYQFIDGILTSKHNMEHIDKIPLVKITKKEWEDTNRGYLPSDKQIKYDLQDIDKMPWDFDPDFY